MSNTDVQLRADRDRNERRAEFCAWSVVAGLALEVVFAIARSLGYEYKFIENWGVVIADCIVTLGVAGEVLFSRKVRTYSDELTRQSEDRLGDAIAQAAIANKRAAALEKEAALLRIKLEREQQKRPPAFCLTNK